MRRLFRKTTQSLWHSPRALAIAVLIFLLWGMPAFSLPPQASPVYAQATDVSPTQTAPHPTPTPIPAEYLQTTGQTTGIILGAVVMVMIILGGALAALRRRNQK